MPAIKALGSNLYVQVLAIALVSRAVITLAMWYTLRSIPSMDLIDGTGPVNKAPADPWIGGWTLWDSAMYAEIAQFGYGPDDGVPRIIRGFFPLYPLVMRGFVALTPLPANLEGYAKSGPWVSQIAFLIAVILFARLVARLHDASIARTACLLLCISPLSFFFSAGYSESLFLLFVIAAFWFALDERWVLAAVMIALAASTRVFGLFLVPAILLIAWRRRASLPNMLAICLISPVGVLGFFLYFWYRYDNFFLYFDTQNHFWAGWHHKVGQFIDTILSEPSLMINDLERFKALLNLGLGLVWLVLLVWVWKNVDPGIALFSTLFVTFHLAYTWHSLGRYMLPAIGVYIAGAILLERPGLNTWVRESVIVVSAVLLAMFTMLHTHGIGIV